MKIKRVLWLPEIVDKLDWKHGLIPEEVEEVFANNPQYRFIERGKISDENVYAAYGRTDGGRYITVIFIRKFDGQGLVISARDMDGKERKQYGRKRK
jgi:uncharacterized DUF497 family protein